MIPGANLTGWQGLVYDLTESPFAWMNQMILGIVVIIALGAIIYIIAERMEQQS